MSYIGKRGASRLDPENLLGLREAEGMLKERKSLKEIKAATGWETGIDGFWRYEIPDPLLETALIEDYVKPRFGEQVNLRLLLRDDAILTAYPEFGKLTLYAMYSPKRGAAGYYNSASGGMVVSMGRTSDKFEFQIEGVLLHEMQHLIQEIEGFAKGGDPKLLGRNRYRRLAGEVEARNVCLRHFLSDAERRQTLRTDTQDIPDVLQILLPR